MVGLSDRVALTVRFDGADAREPQRVRWEKRAPVHAGARLVLERQPEPGDEIEP
jgi:hypothetical protein